MLEQRRQRYRQWRGSPDTEAFFKLLTDAKTDALNAWSEGGYAGKNLEEMAVKNATALGGLTVINQILNLEMFDE